MDVDSLLNTPFQIIIERCNDKSWITAGIISCLCNKELYLLSRVSSDTNLKNYYKQYCKILTDIIRVAKRSVYHNQIINSNNKMKTKWNIIKSVSGRQTEHETSKYQYSPDSFNNFFYQ